MSPHLELALPFFIAAGFFTLILLLVLLIPERYLGWLINQLFRCRKVR